MRSSFLTDMHGSNSMTRTLGSGHDQRLTLSWLCISFSLSMNSRSVNQWSDGEQGHCWGQKVIVEGQQVQGEMTELASSANPKKSSKIYVFFIFYSLLVHVSSRELQGELAHVHNTFSFFIPFPPVPPAQSYWKLQKQRGVLLWKWIFFFVKM